MGICMFLRKGSVHTKPGLYDASTLLLLHGDSLTDASGYNQAITNSGIVVSFAQSKFGGKSLYFDGSSILTAGKSSLLTGENFTIDWWDYDSGNPTWGCVMLQPISVGSTYGMLGGISDGSKVCFYLSTNGTSWDVASGVKMGNITKNTWVHRAIVKNKTSILLFENGSLVNTVTVPSTLEFSAPIILGEHNIKYIGYVDEFRISNVARWTEAFTPPTEQY